MMGICMVWGGVRAAGAGLEEEPQRLGDRTMGKEGRGLRSGGEARRRRGACAVGAGLCRKEVGLQAETGLAMGLEFQLWECRGGASA